MNVSCPDCRSIFRVDPAKVPPSGVRARCSVCSGVISIPAPTGQITPAGGGGRTAAPPSESGSQDRPRSAPAGQGGWDPPPFGSASQRAPAAAPPPAQRPAPPPPPPRTVETPAASRPRPESIERASVTATATPPSPSSGLPEFTPPLSNSPCRSACFAWGLSPNGAAVRSVRVTIQTPGDPASTGQAPRCIPRSGRWRATTSAQPVSVQGSKPARQEARARSGLGHHHLPSRQARRRAS